MKNVTIKKHKYIGYKHLLALHLVPGVVRLKHVSEVLHDDVSVVVRLQEPVRFIQVVGVDVPGILYITISTPGGRSICTC